jgi:hypothetical protein
LALFSDAVESFVTESVRATMGRPWVICDLHGRQRSYVMCVHVMRGASAAIVDPATDTKIGLAVCEACNKEKPNMKLLKLVCEQHARELTDEVPR